MGICCISVDTAVYYDCPVLMFWCNNTANILQSIVVTLISCSGQLLYRVLCYFCDVICQKLQCMFQFVKVMCIIPLASSLQTRCITVQADTNNVGPYCQLKTYFFRNISRGMILCCMCDWTFSFWPGYKQSVDTVNSIRFLCNKVSAARRCWLDFSPEWALN